MRVICVEWLREELYQMQLLDRESRLLFFFFGCWSRRGDGEGMLVGQLSSVGQKTKLVGCDELVNCEVS